MVGDGGLVAVTAVLRAGDAMGGAELFWVARGSARAVTGPHAWWGVGSPVSEEKLIISDFFRCSPVGVLVEKELPLQREPQSQPYNRLEQT